MTIDEMIEVLTAAKEGKAIEVNGEMFGSWVEGDVENFLRELDLRFRVKPAPRRWWLKIGANGIFASVVKPHFNLTTEEIIEVVEVMK